MRRALLALGLVLGAAPLAAQVPARGHLVDGWTRSRTSALQMLDAMPDSALRFRPTPGVRDFSEQFRHLAEVNRLALGGLVAARELAPPADTGAIAGDRKALRAYVARSFDDVLAWLKATPDSALGGDARLFGQSRPRWQWLEVAREHATWTLGQTIPYLRLNGVTPPAYLPF